MSKLVAVALVIAPAIAAAQPVPPPEPEPPPDAVTHDGGFAWQTADQKYQLKLGGYAQARWTGTWHEGEMIGGGFLVRRARTTLEAKLGAPLSFRTMLEWNAQPLLLDLYADWKLTDALKVRVGRDKTPFSRIFLGSASQLTFAERPVVVDAHRWGRDLGAQLRYETARLTAQAGIGNGAVDGAVDRYPAGAARVQVAALGDVLAYGGGDVKGTDAPSITVGADAVIDTVPAPATIGTIMVDRGDPADPDRVDVIAASGDVSFRYRGVEAIAEILYRREDWGDLLDVNPDLEAVIGEPRPSYLGAFGEVTYMVVPRQLMTGLRAGWGELPVLSLRGASAVPRGPEALEVSGLVLFFHDAKRTLGATYTMVDFSENGGTEHRAYLEAQLSL